MGSSSKVASTTMKKKLSLIAKKPNIQSLNDLRCLMEYNDQLAFTRKYGRLFDLLKVNVQVGAITALAQFYDPPLRCFTFQDFLLAPTLEEFEKIMGLSLDKGKPYQYLGHYPKTAKIANLLKVEKLELKMVKEKRKGTVGYLRSFFENRARQLAEAKDWDTFKEVLALIIYGVVLFPKADDLIDKTAIDVFLAFKNRRENPVPAVLADVYYTLNYCHEKKGDRILCCLPVLYVWLVTHMFHHRCIVFCPFSDYKCCDIKIKNGREWAQDLANLNEKRIRWYPKWKEVEEVIYHCGEFPNVPLMGTKGCISYNPAMVLRQLCYPIMEPPTKKMITPFVVYDMGPENMDEVRKVRHAWNKVVKKGRDELGKRCCDVKESYRHWIRERVQIVNLPFKSSEDTPIELNNVENNSEIEKLKGALLKVEEEKKNLQGELRGVRRAYEKLEVENVQNATSLEKANKRAKLEESRKLKFQNNLRVSNELLTKERKERYMALDELENLKRLLTDSRRAEQNIKIHLEDV